MPETQKMQGKVSLPFRCRGLSPFLQGGTPHLWVCDPPGHHITVTAVVSINFGFRWIKTFPQVRRGPGLLSRSLEERQFCAIAPLTDRGGSRGTSQVRGRWLKTLPFTSSSPLLGVAGALLLLGVGGRNPVIITLQWSH